MVMVRCSTARRTNIMSQRFDLYSAIHKALRNYMSAALVQLGRLDLTDEQDVRACTGALLVLFDWLENHLNIEERFVHDALSQRRNTTLVSSLRRDHSEHERSFSLLRNDIAALVSTLSDDLEARRARTRQLYLALSRFIAENFLHMAVEETEMNPLLWETFTDEELFGIYRAVLASERPEQLDLSVRWLLPAIPPDERAQVVGGARAAMPPAIFDALLQQVAGVLGARDYEKLVTALGVNRAA
jgi:iron-sulfur cluster repair protein YtfE (RIC family)